jgi:phenylpropionate dioxygenase-like ring-hydroxylating dioxygenase large terminal subunit
MFLAHKNDIENNCWKVLDQTQGTEFLLNDNGKYYVQSNICTHQGSRIKTGTGRGLASVCPYHGFSWDKDGMPVGEGTVGHANGAKACANDTALAREPVYEWSGFLFSKPIPSKLDISGNYQLMEYRTDWVKSSYVPIMDLFLDVDHIPLVHRGLYDAINIPTVDQIQWESWAGGSVQYVPSTVEKYGALWLAQYPGSMFEWQPGAVFITVAEPVGEYDTRVHVFKYRDHDYSDETWQLNEQIWETAWRQDCEQSVRLEPGWRSLGINNLDPEKQYFRQFIAQ